MADDVLTTTADVLSFYLQRYEGLQTAEDIRASMYPEPARDLTTVEGLKAELAVRERQALWLQAVLLLHEIMIRVKTAAQAGESSVLLFSWELLSSGEPSVPEVHSKVLAILMGLGYRLDLKKTADPGSGAVLAMAVHARW